MFANVENNFHIVYPNSSSATYASMLNYSFEYETPIQRWYRYKEGFSIQFVKEVVSHYLNVDTPVLLDPFAGSGTTVLTSNIIGGKGIGFETNPFSFFLMKTKTQAYDTLEIRSFEESFTEILDELNYDQLEDYVLPNLSISGKVFQHEVEKYIMSCKSKIMKRKPGKVQDLLMLGWLACVEELSNYRKAGNGLKKRKMVRPIITGKESVLNRLEHQYKNMLQDLFWSVDKKLVDNQLYNISSISFDRMISSNSVDGVIFSPPYANCFDYTEIYKLELWFGDFVTKYEDLKKLRRQSIRSHLNIPYGGELPIFTGSEVLDDVLLRIRNVNLWDKKIPYMVCGYFEDMFAILNNCKKCLKENGICAIVVGNSAYGGEIVPTDLILAEYASKIGFKVDSINVDRFIITSSQQYLKTKNNGKYLRESIVCLKK